MKPLLNEHFDISIVRYIGHGKIANSIDEDLELLKAALLYGDKVELVSPTAGLWNRWWQISDESKFSPGFRRDVIKQLYDFVATKSLDSRVDEDATKVLLRVLREGMLENSSSSGRAHSQKDSAASIAWSLIAPRLMLEVVPEPQAVERFMKNQLVMKRLVQDQRLSLADLLDVHAAPAPIGNAPEAVVEVGPNVNVNIEGAAEAIEYITNLATSHTRWVNHALLGADNRYPMFDSLTMDIAKLMTRNTITPGVAKSATAPLARKIFTRLEDFEKASLDEIVDIRKELERDVKRFQYAVAVVSTSLTDIPEADFDVALDDLYKKEVIPSIRELEDKINGNKYLRQLRRSIYTKSPLITGATGGLIMTLTQHPLDVIGASSLITGSIPAISHSIAQYNKGQEEIRKHKFFFVYSLAKKLDARDRRSRRYR